MGTPAFAVPCLNILVENNYEVVAVVTAPDKAAGRGQQIQQSAVKEYAVKKGLRVLQPTNLKDDNFIAELKTLAADLQIVVAFRMLPESVWNMPPLGTYNLHASLLPKYRGAAPINWAIIRGEKETGVTTFKLQHEIDTGNILLNQRVEITDTMTAGELHDKLMEVGSSLILKTVKQIEQSVSTRTALQFIKQDDTQATHAPKIFKDTCRVDWNQSVEDIYNLVRGLSPYPAAWTELMHDDKTSLVKLYLTEKETFSGSATNGSLICDGKQSLKVKCANGYLTVRELQLQGKKRMNVEEFLRGFKMKSEFYFR